MRYKRNIISGHVHRVFNATSNWNNFHEGIEASKAIWTANQYPKGFYNPILKDTVDKIVLEVTNSPKNTTEERKLWFSTRYRGRISDDFKRKLESFVPVKVVFTTRKLVAEG